MGNGRTVATAVGIVLNGGDSMKRMTKLFASIGMGFMFALSCVLGIAALPTTDAAKAEAPVGVMQSNIEIEDGASVRINVGGGVDSAIRM